MSDLVITRLRPGMPVQRRVVRQAPVRTQRSPFETADPFGQSQLAGLGFGFETVAAGAAAGSAGGPVGTAIGAAVGLLQAIPFIKNLLGGKPSRAESTWDGYKAGAGRTSGTDYQEKGFADVIKGAFDANRAVFDNSASGREGFMRDYAAALVSAIKSGKVPVTASVDQIWQSIALPWVLSRVKSAAAFQKNAALTPLLKDIMTRYLANLPITRADMPSFANDKSYTIHAPLILDAFKGWTPPGPAGGNSPTQNSTPQAPVSAVQPTLPISPGVLPPTQNTPTTPPNIPVTGSGSADIGKMIDMLTAQGLNQQQQLSAALQALQSSGVAVTPQVQQAVAQEVATNAATAGDTPMSPTMKYLALGAGALVLFFTMARPKKRGRA